VRIFQAAVLAGLFAGALAGALHAETPQPSERGPQHDLQVFNRELTGPAPSGATVRIYKLPTANPQPGPRTSAGPCAEATVIGGHAQVTPALTSDCPTGSIVGATVDYHDGRPPIVADVIPPIEWRAERPGEGVRAVAIKPVQPHTTGDVDAGTLARLAASADQSSGQVEPPKTGNGDIRKVGGATANVIRYLGLAGLIFGLAVLALTLATRRSLRSRS
jgi:hypothetical protein